LFGHDARHVLDRLTDAPGMQIALEPFRWFVRACTAERLWPDFALWGGLSLAADLGLVVLIFALDVHYLESAAAAGERIYAQLQRMRRGGATSAMLGNSGRVRTRVPTLPWSGSSSRLCCWSVPCSGWP